MSTAQVDRDQRSTNPAHLGVNREIEMPKLKIDLAAPSTGGSTDVVVEKELSNRFVDQQQIETERGMYHHEREYTD